MTFEVSNFISHTALIEEVAGSEEESGVISLMGQSQSHTGSFPLLFWGGTSYMMEEQSCPPQGCFSCTVI